MKAGGKLRNWCWVNDPSFWEITETRQFKLSVDSGNLDLGERDLDLSHVSAFLGFDFLNQFHGVVSLQRLPFELEPLSEGSRFVSVFFKCDDLYVWHSCDV